MILCAGVVSIALTVGERVAEAQDWATRFPPHPDCRLSIRSGPVDPANTGRDSTATLVVWTVRFGSGQPILSAFLTLDRAGDSTHRMAGPTRPTDTATARMFTGLTPGRYSLVVGALGFDRRTDTIVVDAGVIETVRVALELDFDGYRNAHNCRPRGFRRRGESACVTKGHTAESELAYAQTFAEPDRRRAFNLPGIDSSRIELVRNERICKRAGKVYGQPDDPPRRVIVVRMDQLYLVYDPFEPVFGGEFDSHCIYDRSWRTVLCLAT